MMLTDSSRNPSPFRQTLALAAWILFCFSAAGTAAFIAPGGWYAGLIKPSWNPPSWVFGPAWTLLYVMMAVAAWLVWREGGWKAQKVALGWFVAQWTLNALWTPLFFGLHHIGLALIEIVLLWLTLAVTVGVFRRVKPAAGALLIPYLAWVSFATILNFTIWRLNP